MAGTYLGKRKIFNVAIGGIYQLNATWHLNNNGTAYQPMQHFAVESFLDMPLNTQKGSAISAYIGYFNTNYGSNYLCYNGIMNPANGTLLNATNSLTGNKTGNEKGKFLPDVFSTLAKYDKLNCLYTHTINIGVHYLINGQQAKISLDLQNRPVYVVENNTINNNGRLNTLTMQYQLFF